MKEVNIEHISTSYSSGALSNVGRWAYVTPVLRASASGAAVRHGRAGAGRAFSARRRVIHAMGSVCSELNQRCMEEEEEEKEEEEEEGRRWRSRGNISTRAWNPKQGVSMWVSGRIPCCSGHTLPLSVCPSCCSEKQADRKCMPGYPPFSVSPPPQPSIVVCWVVRICCLAPGRCFSSPETSKSGSKP